MPFEFWFFWGAMAGSMHYIRKTLSCVCFLSPVCQLEKRVDEESYHQDWETKKTLREADSQSDHSICLYSQPLPRPWYLPMHSLKTKLFHLNS